MSYQRILYGYYWVQRKLSDVAEEVKGNDGRTNLPVLTISAAKGWMEQKERFSTVIAGTELKNYTLLKQGQLSYNHGNSKLAKYGTVFSLESYPEALVPRVYHSFKVDGKADSKFIEYMFATKLPDRELGKLVSSGARMDGLLNINKSQFMGIRINVPALDEQTKISGLLAKLDDVIAANQRKIDALKAQKSAYLERIFNQKLRFAGFAEPWVRRHLSDIATFSKGKGFSKSDLVSDGFPAILYGRMYTNYESQIDGVNDTFVADATDAVLSQTGDVIVPASGETPEDIARASNVNVSGVVLGGDINIIRPDTEKMDSTFLALTISNGQQQTELIKRAQGKSVVHLHNSDLKKVNVLAPSKDEQSTISSLFTQLDNLIAANQKKIELLQHQKAAYLQKMFI
ncbi:restriction endonuclease subunit S [Weissella confusa]|uniref:restriction endonuclease subunit S n=1 Tax=Weissella confusa TaxID=1583 RepID=UPI0018F1700A|nr:restriction endonuclease subunit S [Weissella confusa]MBJ7697471.1 restriction endonuclease subunit S [Weissella confusa]